MSNYPEEPLEPQERFPSVEDSAAEESALPQEAADATHDKFIAIKSALQDQEEQRQKEEMRVQIADKIQRMKTAKDNPDEPYERSENDLLPAEHDTERAQAPKSAVQPKKRSRKKSSKKAKKSTKKNMNTKRHTNRRGLNLFPKSGDSPFEVIRKCIFLMSSTIFVVCLFLIGEYYWDNYQNAKILGEVQEVYDPDTTDTTKETQPVEEYEYYGLLPTVSALLAQNSEIIGWIKIPDNPKTFIDYPVLQHKIPEDGNEYYLTRNYKLEHQKAGSIFMDYREYFDYVVDGRKQFENSDNLIIYGHNMLDYSMFGSLKKYVNEPDYYDEHPIVYLNSNYRKYCYKIFGMIIVDIDDETDTRFDYWNTIDFADETQFYDYVNEIKRRTVRLTDVDVTYGDQLLTLSTCNSTFSEGRLVVFARLQREGEDLMEGCTSTPNPNIKWPNSYYKWHRKTYDPDAEFIPYG